MSDANEVPKITVTMRCDAEATPLRFVRWRLAPLEVDRAVAPISAVAAHADTDGEPQ